MTKISKKSNFTCIRHLFVVNYYVELNRKNYEEDKINKTN